MDQELETVITGKTKAALVEGNAGTQQIAEMAQPGGIHIATDERIELVPIADLKSYERNPRTHTRKQIRQIAKSIKRFGFNNPVLIDDHNQIIAGHGRVDAAKLLGLSEVPTRRLSHMSQDDVRAYIIADNKLADEGGWDREVLVTELKCLIDLNFDVEVLGFDLGEIEVLLEDTDEAKREAAGTGRSNPEVR